MKKNCYYRFFLTNSLVDSKINDIYHITEKELQILKQLKSVFRVKKGDNLILVNAKYKGKINTEYHFKVMEVDKKSIRLMCFAHKKIVEAINERMGLAFALPNKPAKIADIITHCTELGTTDFYLFKGDNSHFPHKINIERFQVIVKEAAEQSERSIIPTITVYDNLDHYLENLTRPCIVALERASYNEKILEMNINTGPDVLVGPEGGFSKREVALIKSYQLRTYSLGKNILRNQTAAYLSVGIVALKLQK